VPPVADVIVSHRPPPPSAAFVRDAGVRARDEKLAYQLTSVVTGGLTCGRLVNRPTFAQLSLKREDLPM
jgi:hypothetical protein